MSAIPTHEGALLTRVQTAAALKESGFPCAPASLATMASRGGGPKYHRYGARVLYRWADVLRWAESRLSAPRHSTAEGDTSPRAAGAETHAIAP